MDCSPPGCFVHGILQARLLDWFAMSTFRGSSLSRNWTQSLQSHLHCSQILCYWHHLGSPSLSVYNQNFTKNLVLLFLIFSINIRIINKYKRFSLSLQSSTRPIILLSSNKNLHSYKYLEQKSCRSCLFSDASNLTAEFVRQSQKFLLTVLISFTFIYFSLVAFLFISESMRMPVKVDR